MKSKKILKIISIMLSCLILLSNTHYIYASSKINTNNKSDIKEEVVYLKDGEGSLNKGNGTINNPYENIRTALKNIKDGQILKLIGTVSYTNYDVHTDKSPLPLFINKNITIEGNSGKLSTDADCDALIVRSPIQLGANVTFKNINLQLVPQVILGREGAKSILGSQNPMAATIFASGNILTLDNVNTKVGTNSSQDKDRPYLSGGSYKNQGSIGKKSVINIINPNSQTKFSGIYAGDYWEARNLDVEINLDGNILENKIYTGGLSKILTGNVDITLGNKSNIYSFDNKNHNGNINVTIDKDTYMDNLDITGINDLTLNENSKFVLKKDSNLNIKNINLNKNSVIDFRKAKNLNLRGNLIGGSNQSNAGCILLTHTQTLNIDNEVIGFTKLNHLNTIYSQAVVNNHEYVRSNKNSKGNFILDNTVHRGYIVEKSISNNNMIWTTVKGNHVFKDFNWGDEHDKIINPSINEDYNISINFLDNNGISYIPYNDAWDDFEFILKKTDGLILNEDSALYDEDVCFMVNYLVGEVTVNILNENYEGTITLTVKNKKTNKSTSKNITILKEEIIDITPSKPGTVLTLNASRGSYNSIKISWDKVEDADGYKIYTCKSNDGKYTLKSTIEDNNTTNIKISGLNTNTTYYYKIRTYKIYNNKNIYGNYSTVVSAKPTLLKPKIKAEVSSYNSNCISWNEISGASGYAVYASTSKDGKYTLKKTISGKCNVSYVDINLNTNTTYYYKVRAYRTVGTKKVYSSYSSIVSVKPVLSKISLTVSSTTKKATLKWNKILGASGYEVYSSTTANGTYKLKKKITTSSTISYIDSNLVSGKTYYYKVRPYRNINGKAVYGSYSTVKSQRIK